MTLTNTEYKHIVLDENQVPYLANTTLKVVELVMAHLAHGWTPAEIQINHRYLSMGQIHAALAYYWDHKSDLDAVIENDLQAVKRLRLAAGDSPFVSRLKAQGLL
jgi:uncharacterized protein (DUF433 family)